MKIRKSLSLCVLSLSMASYSALARTPDCAIYSDSLDSNGRFKAFRPSDVAFQDDGKIVMVGHFPGGITRLTRGGMVDPTFKRVGKGFEKRAAFSKVLITPDQKIWVGGEFQSYDGVPIRNLLRLNPDGSLDDSFNPAMFGRNPAWRRSSGELFNPTDMRVSDLKYDASTKNIWISARIGYRDDAIFPIRIDGDLDSSSELNHEAKSPDDWLPGIESIGNFEVRNGHVFSGFNELDFNGHLVKRVKPGPLPYRTQISKIYPLSDGRFLALLYSGQPEDQLVRLTAEGQIDPSFARIRVHGRFDVTELPLGRYLLNGGFSYGVVFEDSLVFESDGRLAFDFASNLSEESYAPQAFYNSKEHRFFVVGGNSESRCAYSAYLDPQGKPDLDVYDDEPDRYEGNILSELPNDKLLVDMRTSFGGIYALINGPERKVTRLYEVDSKTGKVLRAIADRHTWFGFKNSWGELSGAKVQNDDQVMVWGEFKQYGEPTPSDLVRIDLKTGKLDTQFQSSIQVKLECEWGRRCPFNLTPLADGRYFVSGVFSIITDPTRKIYHYGYLRRDGSIDPALPPVSLLEKVSGQVSFESVEVTGHLIFGNGDILVSGLFERTGGERSSYLRLSSDGIPRSISGSEGGFIPAKTQFWNGHVLALGYYGEEKDWSLVLQDEKSGRVLPGFEVPESSYVRSFELLKQDRILIGYQLWQGTLPGPFAIIDAHGAVQRTITPAELGMPMPESESTRWHWNVDKMIRLGDGSVIAALSFYKMNEAGSVKMIKFDADGNLDSPFSEYERLH